MTPYCRKYVQQLYDPYLAFLYWQCESMIEQLPAVLNKNVISYNYSVVNWKSNLGSNVIIMIVI